MSLSAGEVLDDRYRLVAPLGEGGQGAVWRAVDLVRPDVHVAIKLLPIASASAVDMDRLRREARALAALSHPSLVACHRLFEDLHRHVLGLVLELVDGAPLSAACADFRFSRAHAAAVLGHVASALAHLHAAGLVHRDIKPQNVLVAAAFWDRPQDPSTVKLADLGIATAEGNPHPLTEVGTVIGTVAYLAPELLDPSFWQAPKHAPARDVFAFGVLAMELLHRTHPTGLPESAGVADYLLTYRRFADAGAAWPPSIEGDPFEHLYRSCLALRATDRATDAAAVVSLLRRAPALTPPVAPDLPPPPPPGSDGLGGGIHRPSAFAATRPVLPAMQTAAHAVPFSARPSDATTGAPSVSRTLVPTRLPKAAIFLIAASLPLAFIIAFLVTRATSEPGDDDDLPLPAAFPRAPSPTPLVSPSAPADASCPAGMALVVGQHCVDQTPVTVAQFTTWSQLPETASWPLATPEELAEENAHCNGGKSGRGDHPANCVDMATAERYCASLGKRLPTVSEWIRAAAAPGASRSTCPPRNGTCAVPRPASSAALVELGGNVFEWTVDRTPEGWQRTCGGSWKFPNLHRCVGKAPAEARNADLGFRCASDPR